MKSALYFLFGIICTLFVLVSVFNNTYDWYIDDNVIELLHNNQEIWFYSTLTISILFASSVLIWAFQLGKSTKESSKESLLNHI